MLVAFAPLFWCLFGLCKVPSAARAGLASVRVSCDGDEVNLLQHSLQLQAPREQAAAEKKARAEVDHAEDALAVLQQLKVYVQRHWPPPPAGGRMGPWTIPCVMVFVFAVVVSSGLYFWDYHR